MTVLLVKSFNISAFVLTTNIKNLTKYFQNNPKSVYRAVF